MQESLSLSFHKLRENKHLAQFLKICISLTALVYIVYSLGAEEISLLELLKQMSHWDLLLAACASAMVAINWSLEATKWQLALKNLYPQLRWVEALKGVLAGIASGIFTPNRVGDYVGRLIFIGTDKKWEAGLVLMIDRLCQLVITLWTGAFCFAYMLQYEFERIRHIIPLEETGIQILLWVLLLLSICLPLLLVFVHKVKLPPVKHKKLNGWIATLNRSFEVLSAGQVLAMLGISMLRYICFSTQYFLLMTAMGYPGDFFLGFLLIGLIFLVKSLIPYISFTELGLRESVAIFVMGAWQIAAYTAFSSTLLLYVINLIFPALIGMLILHTHR